MLLFERKTGEAVVVDLVEGLDPRTPIGQLFAGGPIRIAVWRRGRGIKMGVEADGRLLVLRAEDHARRCARPSRPRVR